MLIENILGLLYSFIFCLIIGFFIQRWRSGEVFFNSKWKILLILINILFSPLIFWFYGNYLIPESIYQLDNYFISNITAGLASSVVASIVILFILLVSERRKFDPKEALYVILVPIPFSIIFSPITVGFTMFIAMFISCAFSHVCSF